jgi:endonuclease YncB( thermonuclease family)
MHSSQHQRSNSLLQTAKALAICAFFAVSTHAAEVPSPLLTGVVTKVVDADTIDVQLTSGALRVRLHGIDAPEKTQPWGREATDFLTSKILNQPVELEPFQQDRYERMIAIVHQGDVNVNAELVRLGHAWAYRQYMRKLDAALCAYEAEARLAKRGLWSLPRDERVAPWEYRKRKTLDTFTDYSVTNTAQCVAAIGKR